MPLILTWKGPIGQPIHGESLRIDALGGSLSDVSKLQIGVGNSVVEMADLFDLEGDGRDKHWIFEGDLTSIGGLASGMTAGRLEIRGNAGPRLGERMSGGSIEVEGSAGLWAGAEMLGGLLRIKGNTGDLLGAALPGSRLGMREGVILVEGDAGDDIGLALRRGLIAVRGRMGRNAGRGLIAGSIFGFGTVGSGVGCGMKRGTIALFGAGSQTDFEILATFEPSGSFRPHVLPLYLKSLNSLGFEVPESAFTASIRRYNGDRIEKGRGEIWVASHPGE